MHGTHPHDAYILAKETDINKLYVSLQACAMKNYKTLCLFPCIWSASCHTLLCTDSPLFQPRHTKMTLSLNAPVKPTPAQTPTPSGQARPGHSRVSVTMQGLRLVHGPTPPAPHQRLLRPGWGGAGERPSSSWQWEGEGHRWPHGALGRGDPLSTEPSAPPLPALSGPEVCRGPRRSVLEAGSSHCAAAPPVWTPPARSLKSPHENPSLPSLSSSAPSPGSSNPERLSDLGCLAPGPPTPRPGAPSVCAPLSPSGHGPEAESRTQAKSLAAAGAAAVALGSRSMLERSDGTSGGGGGGVAGAGAGSQGEGRARGRDW